MEIRSDIPFLIASLMRNKAALSFTDPPPLQNSALARISQPEIKYGKYFKILNTFLSLSLFSKIILVIGAGIPTKLVKITIREDPDLGL